MVEIRSKMQKSVGPAPKQSLDRNVRRPVHAFHIKTKSSTCVDTTHIGTAYVELDINENLNLVVHVDSRGS